VLLLSPEEPAMDQFSREHTTLLSIEINNAASGFFGCLFTCSVFIGGDHSFASGRGLRGAGGRLVQSCDRNQHVICIVF
jgi:hypothetical protein